MAARCWIQQERPLDDICFYLLGYLATICSQLFDVLGCTCLPSYSRCDSRQEPEFGLLVASSYAKISAPLEYLTLISKSYDFHLGGASQLNFSTPSEHRILDTCFGHDVNSYCESECVSLYAITSLIVSTLSLDYIQRMW